MVHTVKPETPYQAYQLYVAIKNHFSTSYDYFKYGGKVKTQYSSYEVRKDKYFFTKLQKHSDPIGLLVSQFVDNPNAWIGDIVNFESSEMVYNRWKNRQDSLTYLFKQNIQALPTDKDKVLEVIDGQHPLLLQRYIGTNIYPETVILLNFHLNFFPYWENAIDDHAIWPVAYKTLVKYTPFVKQNKTAIKKIIVDYFGD